MYEQTARRGCNDIAFIVNHDGIVYEKDLGSGTDATARKMNAYNPDKSWRQVQ